jgi:hypothetical protein
MPGEVVYYPPGTYQNEPFEDGVFDGGGIWKNSSDTIIKLNGVRGNDDQLIIIEPLLKGTVKLQYDGNSAIELPMLCRPIVATIISQSLATRSITTTAIRRTVHVLFPLKG